MLRRIAQIDIRSQSAKQYEVRSGEELENLGAPWGLDGTASPEGAQRAVAVVGSICDGLVAVDESGQIVDVNPRFVEMTGLDRNELLGQRRPYPFWAEEDRDANTAACRRLVAQLQTTDGVGEVELGYCRKDRARFPVVVSVARLHDVHAHVSGHLAVIRDMTRRRPTNSAATEQGALERVAATIATGAIPAKVFAQLAAEIAALTRCDTASIYRFDGGRMTVIGSSGAAAYSVGATFPTQGIGALPQVARTGAPARVADYEVLRATDPTISDRVHPSYHAAIAVPITVGDQCWGSILVATTHDRPLPPDCEQTLLRFVPLANIALAGTDARSRLETIAFRDPLTGLGTRRNFEEWIAAATAGVSEDAEPLSVAILDIDGLRNVNAEFGPDAGDRLICEVAKHLCGLVRGADRMARISGGTFGWLLHDTDEHGARNAAERARITIAATQFAHARQITVSVGICDLAGTHGRSKDVLRLAEIALYQAKAAGRDMCVRYRPTGGRGPHPIDNLRSPRSACSTADLQT